MTAATANSTAAITSVRARPPPTRLEDAGALIAGSLVSYGRWCFSGCCFGERRAFQHGPQAQNGPLLTGAPKGTGEVPLAASDRWRCVAGELAFSEAPEPEHLIDEQPRGNFTMVHHNHT